MNILVLCTGNACRSQIAQGYFQHFMGEKAVVYSAGVEIHGVNPYAIATMKEDGIDISQHTCNHVGEYEAVDFDLVLTVCDSAKERCPILPVQAKKAHHSFNNLGKVTGSEDEIKAAFRKVRNEIKEYIEKLIREEL